VNYHRVYFVSIPTPSSVFSLGCLTIPTQSHLSVLHGLPPCHLHHHSLPAITTEEFVTILVVFRFFILDRSKRVHTRNQDWSQVWSQGSMVAQALDPGTDLGPGQIRQIYSNGLKFFAVPCPEYPRHARCFPVLFPRFFDKVRLWSNCGNKTNQQIRNVLVSHLF
jgi:hypothetical protein